MESLEVTDRQSAAVAVAPRVTLDDIKSKIAMEHFFTGGDAVRGVHQPSSEQLDILTICILEMANGFTVIGKSAPASPENYDADLGRKFAKEDAIRQIWPLEGYALRDRLVA